MSTASRKAMRNTAQAQGTVTPAQPNGENGKPAETPAIGAAVAKVVDAIRKGTVEMPPVYTGGKVSALVLAGIAIRKADADGAQGRVLASAGVALHTALSGNLLGKGKPFGTQGDYLESMGYGKSMGAVLKRVGRVIVVHGFADGSPEFTMASNPSRSGLTSAKADALIGKTPTDNNRAAISKAAAKAAVTRKRSAGGSTKQTESKATAARKSANSALDTLGTVLGLGEGETSHLSPAARKGVVSRLTSILAALEAQDAGKARKTA